MQRRDFIKLLGSSALALPMTSLMAKQQLAQSLEFGNWTSYRLSYQIKLPEGGEIARLWLPLPDTNDSVFQFTQGSNWDGNATKAVFSTLGPNALPVFSAEWQGGHSRQVTVSCIVKTANHAVDLRYYTPAKQSAIPNSIKQYLNPTHLKPTNGIVRETAQLIVKEKQAVTPLEQAKALYDWVVDNTQYTEETPGRGTGDIKSMLEKSNLSGKCVDINSLFVGLAKALNIPARNHYGIRMNDSKLYPSIGNYGDISQSQHSRAEFYLAGYGWIPVNPADVKQVSKLENISLDDPSLLQLRDKFFGAWEMNWVAFNHTEDLTLASNINKLAFFMYPYAEIDGMRLDSLNPEQFSYKVISAELIGTGARF